MNIIELKRAIEPVLAQVARDAEVSMEIHRWKGTYQYTSDIINALLASGLIELDAHEYDDQCLCKSCVRIGRIEQLSHEIESLKDSLATKQKALDELL